MRLLTHNMLRCNAKGVTSGYPLQIEIARDPATGAHVEGAVQVSEAEFNPEFLVRTLPKLEWAPFLAAARQIGVDGTCTRCLFCLSVSFCFFLFFRLFLSFACVCVCVSVLLLLSILLLCLSSFFFFARRVLLFRGASEGERGAKPGGREEKVQAAPPAAFVSLVSQPTVPCCCRDRVT